MRKWLPIKRVQKVPIETCTVAILCLIAVIQFFASYASYNYNHIPRDKIDQSLYLHANPNLAKRPKPDCRYEGVYQKIYPDDWDIGEHVNHFKPTGIANGSFVPDECNPSISVALLVTYRNRQSQLDLFIPFIHSFLRKQNIHYKIYVVEQQDDKSFNKGLLYNVGARQAISDGFPCLVLHDVDLLPLNAANLYACTQQPRHMSASIDKFRFNLPYRSLAGGVLAVRADHFAELDGFSNAFLAWGGEDDEFASRMRRRGLDLLRFPPDISRYTMLVHEQATKNGARHRLLARARLARDGLRSLPPHRAALRPHRLFTMIGVQT